MLSQDFYPTPKTLIRKMLDGVALDHRSYVLEPSAGKGDICDYIKNDYQQRRYHSAAPHIDVIELDADLQHVLRGKGYNLVHDDFLTFDTQRAYDLIVANFPFSDGDAHLQRALALLERTGGALVCLVNAETIRNPYTTLRQSVVNTLTNAGATIEYIQDAFAKSERPTDVEVALVRVTFDRPKVASILLDDLKKADPVIRQAEEQRDVIDANPIAALVARYNLEARAGVRLIDEYFSLLPYISEAPSRDALATGKNEKRDGLILLKIGGTKYSRDGTVADTPGEGINAYLEALREKYWSLLIHNDNFSRAYTSNVLDELNRRMDELKQADFSLFNIRKLEEDLRGQIRAGVEKAILDLFDEFTIKFHWNEELNNGNIHYFNGWKTNKAYKVGQKVILPVNGLDSGYDKRIRLDYHVRSRLNDMVKVFRYLEQDEADVSEIVANAENKGEALQLFRNMDLHYFTTTFYLKRTCHIRFTNQRLLDKFNIFAAQRRGWLPPGYGKKSYAEMEPEEQAVVDSFQGAEAYAQVVAEKDYYLVTDASLLLAAGSLTGDPDTASASLT